MQFHAVANYFGLKWRAATYSIKIKNNFKFANDLINNKAIYTNDMFFWPVTIFSRAAW